MPKHEEDQQDNTVDSETFPESLSGEEQTPWQKYRTRKRLGLEGPASPESTLIIDMLHPCKPQDNIHDD